MQTQMKCKLNMWTKYQQFKSRMNKLLFHWKSTVPRNYKQNVIVGDLHHGNIISSDLEQKISIIKTKYLEASYLCGFIDSVIFHQFSFCKFHQTKKKLFFLQNYLKNGKLVSRYCFVNEEMKQSVCKLAEYKNYKIKFMYSWKTCFIYFQYTSMTNNFVSLCRTWLFCSKLGQSAYYGIQRKKYCKKCMQSFM